MGEDIECLKRTSKGLRPWFVILNQVSDNEKLFYILHIADPAAFYIIEKDNTDRHVH